MLMKVERKLSSLKKLLLKHQQEARSQNKTLKKLLKSGTAGKIHSLKFECDQTWYAAYLHFGEVRTIIPQSGILRRHPRTILELPLIRALFQGKEAMEACYPVYSTKHIRKSSHIMLHSDINMAQKWKHKHIGKHQRTH